jgi:hypothetical protein
MIHSAVIPEAAAGGCPESISTIRGYGFRARRFAAPRNDGRVEIAQYVFAAACGTWPRASRTAAEAAFAIRRASLRMVHS